MTSTASDAVLFWGLVGLVCTVALLALAANIDRLKTLYDNFVEGRDWKRERKKSTQLCKPPPVDPATAARNRRKAEKRKKLERMRR